MKNGKSQPPDIANRAFDFSVRVVKLCDFLHKKRGVASIVMSQILRAGTSVVANIEEAQGAQSKADFISKMSIALKEARETHVRLRILAAAEIVPNERLAPIIQEAEEISLILGAIIVSSKRSATP